MHIEKVVSKALDAGPFIILKIFILQQGIKYIKKSSFSFM